MCGAAAERKKVKDEADKTALDYNHYKQSITARPCKTETSPEKMFNIFVTYLLRQNIKLNYEAKIEHSSSFDIQLLYLPMPVHSYTVYTMFISVWWMKRWTCWAEQISRMVMPNQGSGKGTRKSRGPVVRSNQDCTEPVSSWGLLNLTNFLRSYTYTSLFKTQKTIIYIYSFVSETVITRSYKFTMPASSMSGFVFSTKIHNYYRKIEFVNVEIRLYYSNEKETKVVARQ